MKRNIFYYLICLYLRKKKVTFGESSFIEPSPTPAFTGFNFGSSTAPSTSTNPFDAFTFSASSQSSTANTQPSRYRPAARGGRGGRKADRIINAFNNLKIDDGEVKDKDEEKKDEERQDLEEKEVKENTDGTEIKVEKIEKVKPTQEDWENIIFPGLEQYLKDDGLDTWVISEWMRRVRQEYAKVTNDNYLEVFHYITHHVTHGSQPPALVQYFPEDDVSLTTDSYLTF